MDNGSAGHFPEVNMTKYSYTQVKQDGLNKTIAHPTPVLSTNIKDAGLKRTGIIPWNLHHINVVARSGPEAEATKVDKDEEKREA